MPLKPLPVTPACRRRHAWTATVEALEATEEEWDQTLDTSSKAVFAPANKMHKIEVDPEEDLTYVLIYAPPGPEQQLKEKGARAFDEK